MGYLLVFMFVLIMSILLYRMYQEAFSDRTLIHELCFQELPVDFGSLTIFFISDIHRRLISETIIQNAKGKAEIVIIGGDLAEKGVRLEQVKENLIRLKQIGPVYFVWGNNDYELDTYLLRKLMTELEINILENTSINLKKQIEANIDLLGVDDTTVGQSDLEHAIACANEESFKILVSHNPNIIDSITSEHHIQFILSGHTHGGQIRLFGFGLYQKGGIKKIGKTLLFVSNGYGTTTLPLRLGAQSETHLITLKHS